MDAALIYVHHHENCLFAFTVLLMLLKFACCIIFLRGNIVESIGSFFRIFSSVNIDMTENNRHRILKRSNNVTNILIYLMVLVLVIAYNVYPQEY